MLGNLGIAELLTIIIMYGLVIAAAVAFFRGMRALIDMSRRLERIEALLSDGRGRA